MLSYGDFQIGRKIENAESGEAGEIESLGNGMVEVLMTQGRNVGYSFSFSPQELNDWSKVS